MLRIMKAPGARPAVGAAEHRTRSMRIVDAAQFRGGPVEGFVPRHGDELVATASRVRRRAALEPSAPDHRSRDACLVRHRGGNIAEERRGDRVARMRHDLEAAILDEYRERAPMRAMRQAADLVHDPESFMPSPESQPPPWPAAVAMRPESGKLRRHRKGRTR